MPHKITTGACLVALLASLIIAACDAEDKGGDGLSQGTPLPRIAVYEGSGTTGLVVANAAAAGVLG